MLTPKQQPQPQQQQPQQQQQQQQMHHTMKAPASIHNSLARSMVTSSDWVPKQPAATSSSSSSSSSSSNNKLSSNNQSYNIFSSNRVAREVPSETTGDQVDTKKVDPRECDGTDAIGCYTVRVYYDWFLVPGSCKCWKKQGSFDALKKIFTGK